MSRIYLIVAEQREGKIRQVTLEALQAAASSAADGDRMTAVLIGSGLDSMANELSAYPLSEIHLIEHAGLQYYNPESYTAALLPVIENIRPDAVFLGHTALGRDLAP
ncbi:electron transfer flavoprotein subunit alpha/FixB family protein, partial [Paenibacillus sepulcri]|nr:electron transfer flavoprotein subunit alpha/FixB family protein [Paenibacillus sepulcri]